MSMDELFGKIESLLDRERAAIRRLDAAAVELIATEKEVAFTELRRAAAANEELQARLADIARRVRQNAVLLAYARDTVREALGLVARNVNETSTSGRGLETRARAVRVSVSR